MKPRRILSCLIVAGIVGAMIYGRMFRSAPASAEQSPGVTKNGNEPDSNTQSTVQPGEPGESVAETGTDSTGKDPESATDKTTGSEKREDSAAVTDSNGADAKPNEPALTEDERMTQLIVGKWETDRDGIRKLTVNDDGTAVMDVALEGLYAFTFGDQIIFNIEWTIKDGDLIFETTGGKPKTSVDLVVKMYGKERTQPILELSETRMLLKDADEGEPDHDWKRVE